jgi:hypothetical protein
MVKPVAHTTAPRKRFQVAEIHIPVMDAVIVSEFLRQFGYLEAPTQPCDIAGAKRVYHGVTVTEQVQCVLFDDPAAAAKASVLIAISCEVADKAERDGIVQHLILSGSRPLIHTPDHQEVYDYAILLIPGGLRIKIIFNWV